MRRKIIAGIIIVILIIGIILMLTNNNNNNEETKSKIPEGMKEELKHYIEKINKLNSNFSNETLSNEDSYIQESTNNTCYKYVGDNTKDIIQNIDSYYYNFNDRELQKNLNFNVKFTENNTETIPILFVCIPKECKITEISEYEFIDTVSDGYMVMLNKNSNYIKYYSIKNRKWMFTSTIIPCENNE